MQKKKTGPVESWRHQPGAEASGPEKYPWKAWKQILWRTGSQIIKDQVTMMAAGVAFYAFLSVIPILIASISIYGWVMNPDGFMDHWGSLLSLMPPSAAGVIEGQLSSITSQRDSVLGLTTIISLLVAIWSGSAGVNALVAAINNAYGEKETRNFIQLRALSIALTFGFLLFGLISLTAVAAIPAIAEPFGLGDFLRSLIEWGRWPLLAVVFCTWLAVLYRFAPDRNLAKWRWLTPGSIVGAFLWLAASIVFSIYVERFSNLGATYGSLAGIVVLLMWLYISSFAILLGAEMNAEMEHQTMKDSTKGPEKPMGRRNALVADTVPRR